jgi:hypothetical protein
MSLVDDTTSGRKSLRLGADRPSYPSQLKK